MMERLTEKHYLGNGYYMKCTENCNGEDIDCIDCAALDKLVDRLGGYEDTGLTPGEVRSLWGERNAIMSVLNSISYDRIRELAEADKDGRLVVLPKSENETCGSCQHFKRIMGTRRGTCDIRPFLMNKWGCAQPERGTFEPSQSRKCCKQYSCREEAEQAVKEAKEDG